VSTSAAGHSGGEPAALDGVETELALTLAGIIAAFVATNAMWAVISWAIGGVAAFVLVAVQARRG
jgi:hypothetical protein